VPFPLAVVRCFSAIDSRGVLISFGCSIGDNFRLRAGLIFSLFYLWSRDEYR